MITRIIIPLREREKSFKLVRKDEAAMLAAIAEAQRGETIEAADLLRKIRGK